MHSYLTGKINLLYTVTIQLPDPKYRKRPNTGLFPLFFTHLTRARTPPYCYLVLSPLSFLLHVILAFILEWLGVSEHWSGNQVIES